MLIIDNITDFYRRLRRPSYLLPEPKSPSRKEIEAARKEWAQRDQRRKKLEESKAYLSYETPYPVHLEDYIYIDTDDWVEPNPVLYQIVVPLTQEFYYKGRMWRFTDDYWKKIGCVRGACKSAEKFYTKKDPYRFNQPDNLWDNLSDGLAEGYQPTEFNLDEIKANITNIRIYNKTKIQTLKYCYVEAVEFHLAMGSEGVFEKIGS